MFATREAQDEKRRSLFRPFLSYLPVSLPHGPSKTVNVVSLAKAREVYCAGKVDSELTLRSRKIA